MWHSLTTLSQLHKDGPWAWNTFYQEIKSPYSLCRAYHLVLGISFLLSGSMNASLSLLQACTSYGQPYCSVLCQERTGLFLLCHSGACTGRLSCAGNGGTTPSIEADLALSPLYVGKALLQPVLVFSLVTPLPRCRGQKCPVLPWDW